MAKTVTAASRQNDDQATSATHNLAVGTGHMLQATAVHTRPRSRTQLARCKSARHEMATDSRRTSNGRNVARCTTDGQAKQDMAICWLAKGNCDGNGAVMAATSLTAGHRRSSEGQLSSKHARRPSKTWPAACQDNSVRHVWATQQKAVMATT
jgi:hypothetical protein